MIIPSSLTLKLKHIRRKRRISILMAIIFLLITAIVLFDNYSGSKSYLWTDDVKVDDKDNNKGRWSLRKLKFFNRKKTVPFAQTNVAAYSEFSNLMASTSQDSLNGLENLDKLKVIYDSYLSYDPKQKLLATGYKYYEKIFEVFYRGQPRTSPLTRYESKDRIYHARYDTKDEKDDTVVFNEKYLSSFLHITKNERDSLKQAHDYVVKNLPDKMPNNLYSGNGIVYVGGGKFNWLTLLSIKSIRAIGCTLPIEVLIPNLKEYEADLCLRVFPALNTRCIYLPLVLNNGLDDSYVSKFKFKGYQYKALAILFSSFENVLLLDSDNIPVHSVEGLFNSEPFNSKGLIVWPDFWRRATSPHYYEIAGVSISKNKLQDKYDEVNGRYFSLSPDNVEDVASAPLHLRKGAIPDPTSESGQLMISKKTHMKALLLALYYNLYGPSYFYPLFSQGSDGEGDKETFLAATVALGKPFYQVSKFLEALGYFDEKGAFQGTGMGQYDPQQDYKCTLNKDAEPGSRILFVHSNFPKLNPWELKETNALVNDKGERVRLYGTGMKKRCGYDFETVQWDNMKFLICELKIRLNIFAPVDLKDLCEEITTHLDFLRSTVKTLE